MATAAHSNPTESMRVFAGRWSDFSLTRRYALASFPVILSLMLFVGWWVNRAIEEQVIENTAVNVALYVQGFLAPVLQGLASREFLSEDEMRQLEELIANTPLGQKILSVKVWKDGGRIAYDSRHALIGERFEVSQSLKSAWQGDVTAEFDELHHSEDSEEAKLGLALLEVYSPVRQQGKDKIIAVAEFYQDAEALSVHLRETRLNTWFIVTAATLCAYGLLFSIVHRGSHIIRRQREALRGQVRQLSALLHENEKLGERLKRAAQRTTEINEKLLRRVSADLHDGPAQSMSLALLRLDSMLTAEESGTSQSIGEIVAELRATLQESMTELRHISRGLALPDLEGLSLIETIERVATAHGRRTHTDVDLRVDTTSLNRFASMSVKLTLYRTIQEALMNAYRHADGKDQCVQAKIADDELHLSISDKGPGFSPDADRDADEHLGLHGLRERIESLGGRFGVTSEPGQGTTIRAVLPLTTAP